MWLSNSRLSAFILMTAGLYSCANNETYQAKDWQADKTFTQGVEGPAVDKNGFLYAVNFQTEGTIGRVLAKNETELFIRLPSNSIGNGIRFDLQGNMYIADYVNHNILLVDIANQKKNNAEQRSVEVYAHSASMNQPNDLAIMDNGTLFASDPNWKLGTGQLWKIDSDRKVTLLEKNMGTTNGIAVSPNNKILYVNESVQGNIWRYQLSVSGAISKKTLLISFDDYGLDGMRTDKEGNLYIARYGKGVIAVVSPKGQLLREVKLKGQYPTNIAFGGAAGKTVFVTMQKRGAIETFKVDVPGRYY